jgi:DUF971 family protein
MPNPIKVTYHQKARVLELDYDDGSTFKLPAEYLRVYSPSAEVIGHGPGQETLQVDKEDVGITEIEQQGNYALMFVFDDKHDSGIYSWDYLYDLGISYEEKWQDYLARLEAAGHKRKLPD